jgi:hypothetical protein
MADTRMVIIRHPQTGHEYAIEPKDFTRKNVHPDRKSYADIGFVIDRYEDGSEYAGPKSKREIEQAAEAKHAPKAPEKGKAS